MALVLTLNEGDFIFIGENITLAVKRKKGSGHMMLAIEAPRDVQITRSGHLKKKQRELDSELERLKPGNILGEDN